MNFHYTMNEEEYDFLCNAIEFIANYGYLFISQYKLDIFTGLWTHKSFKESTKLLDNFDINTIINMNLDDVFTKNSIDRKREYNRYLEEAISITSGLQHKYEENFSKLPSLELENIGWFYFNNN